MDQLPTSTSDLQFIAAELIDFDELDGIRARAFQPIFDSFRNILGNTIYDYAQAPQEEAQKEWLRGLFNEDSAWVIWKVLAVDQLVGFLSVNLDAEKKVGEIGLNAIDPVFGGQGYGAQMYQYAVDYMKAAGMKVATVGTGGDPSHLPARKAYRKAGFQAEIPSVWMCQEL